MSWCEVGAASQPTGRPGARHGCLDREGLPTYYRLRLPSAARLRSAARGGKSSSQTGRVRHVHCAGGAGGGGEARVLYTGKAVTTGICITKAMYRPLAAF